MSKETEESRKFFYIGSIITSLGIILSTTMSHNYGVLGIVFIAIGGSFFILGIRKKGKRMKKRI